MMTTHNNDCGTKHYQLALWIIGTVVVTILLIVGSAFTYAMHSDVVTDDKVRTLEMSYARAESKIDIMSKLISNAEERLRAIEIEQGKISTSLNNIESTQSRILEILDKSIIKNIPKEDKK